MGFFYITESAVVRMSAPEPTWEAVCEQYNLNPDGSTKQKPEVVPEVWATPDPDTDYMAAVRAMCGDVK